MGLYANSEKLTELFGLDGSIVKISDKVIYFGELKAWKRAATATHNLLDVETVYTKTDSSSMVGSFIYNESGDLYVAKSGNVEYCFYVKSADLTAQTMVVSYDTYDNIKSGSLSSESPLGEEAIAYERYADKDISL